MLSNNSTIRIVFNERASTVIEVRLTNQLVVYYFTIRKHLVLSGTIAHQNTCRRNSTTTNSYLKATAYAPIRKTQQRDYLTRAIPNPIDGNIVITPEETVRLLSQSAEPRNAIKGNQHFVRIRNQMVSTLELVATRNVILSVIYRIMLLFALPWIIISSVYPLSAMQVLSLSRLTQSALFYLLNIL